jgi:hypothetical protein
LWSVVIWFQRDSVWWHSLLILFVLFILISHFDIHHTGDFAGTLCTAFDVRKSVHHSTIQINYPTRCNSFTSLLLDVYVWLNMFRALSRPSSGA